jgi:hypothetical protein
LSTGIRSVTIWVNAFLPRDIAGRTTTLLDGPCAGKTAIVGPAYDLTDQRGFSRAREASSRMHSCFAVDFTASTPTVAQVHRCDPTVMCEPGAPVPRRARASVSRMAGVVSSVTPLLAIRLDAVTAHPFPGLASIHGDIAYRGDIAIDPATRTIAVDLMVQLFPAFEGYASIDDGSPAILFHHAPPPGVTEMHLLAVPQRRIRCALRDSDGDGVFDAAIPPGIAGARFHTPTRA